MRALLLLDCMQWVSESAALIALTLTDITVAPHWDIPESWLMTVTGLTGSTRGQVHQARRVDQWDR